MNRDEEGLSKAVIIVALLGVAVMGLGVYISTVTEPIIGAGIIFVGGSLLVLPMTKALL